MANSKKRILENFTNLGQGFPNPKIVTYRPKAKSLKKLLYFARMRFYKSMHYGKTTYLHCKKYRPSKNQKWGYQSCNHFWLLETPLFTLGFENRKQLFENPYWFSSSDSKNLRGYWKTHDGFLKTCNLVIRKTVLVFSKTTFGVLKLYTLKKLHAYTSGVSNHQKRLQLWYPHFQCFKSPTLIADYTLCIHACMTHKRRIS
jgi:hypothetical protein